MLTLEKIFRNHNIPFLKNEPLGNWCTFKIGGNASYFVEPSSNHEVALVITESEKIGVPIFILGRGSNILFSDAGFSGVVVHLGKNMAHMERIEDNRIFCQAGAKLTDLCMFALEQELTGMEELYGIPGSVGGAAYMNAGAYGREIKDIAYSATHIDLEGREGEYFKNKLDLSYRRSVYTYNSFIITGLTVELTKGNARDIKTKMDAYMQKRKEKQPLEYASAGSTFKRPIGGYASALIDECGLKGYGIGDAQVSEKHAGFVINKGEASYEQVISVIETVKAEVLKQKNMSLECEIKIID